MPLPPVAADALLTRIVGEFCEMPGLRLTIPQASRLWGLDAAVSARLLRALVDARVLTEHAGVYVRLNDGPVNESGLRTAKAALDRDTAGAA